MAEWEYYYQVLGLDLGASLEEINQAYHDLAFVWHPDRLPAENKRLLAKATAKLQEINLAREELQRLSQQGLETKTQDRTSAPEKGQETREKSPSSPSSSKGDWHQRPYYKDLSGADLRGANLKERDLSGHKLIHANLSHADLSDSFLHRVNLEGANLFQANLRRANLLEANLRQANLQEVNLLGADLSGADLSEADLRGAKVMAGSRMMVKLTAVILKGTILPDGSVHP